MDSTTLDECISRMYPDTCGMPEDAKIWSILFDGVLAGITSGLGIIFNIASLVVLFDPPSINLFDQLLISLAFCDVTFLCKPLLITIESKIFRSNYAWDHTLKNVLTSAIFHYRLQVFICQYAYINL